MSHDDPRRPSQKAPTLDIASGLSDDFTYGGIWTGQSNSQPWGLPSDATNQDYALELTLQPPGADLIDTGLGTGVQIPDNAARADGMEEELLCGPEVIQDIYNTSTWLRLGNVVRNAAVTAQAIPVEPAPPFVTGIVVGQWYEIAFVGTTDFTAIGAASNMVGVKFQATGSGSGTGTVLELTIITFEPIAGYAKVLRSETQALTVRWIKAPDPSVNNTRQSGYLVRENGKFYSYENCKVLTPHIPWRDIEPPIANGLSVGANWAAPRNSEYRQPNARLGDDGQSLTLPAPYNNPTQVADFEDQGVFLTMTRREGADGYGISEIADGSFDGRGDPTGHPISDYDGSELFTFLNAIPTTVDLTNAYVLIDWQDATPVSKRSWSRVVKNTDTTFTTDGTWLGDGEPTLAPPTSNMVTFDGVQNRVDWDSPHGFVEGDRVVFDGTVPAEVTAGRPYYVRNPSGDFFQISESPGYPVLEFATSGTNTNGYLVWKYTVWIPHWRDNPFMYLPGPEFAYPNEDSQPRASFIHWRARGQVLWAYNNKAEPGSGQAFIEPFEDPDSRFGALLPYAWRTGSAIGKVMHMVMLGIGSMPLAPAHAANAAASIYTGILGWWNYERYGFGIAMEDTTSYLSQRLKRLVEFMAPEALKAEGITEPLRYLTHTHIQGEADGFTYSGKDIYRSLIAGFRDWMRAICDDAGLSPFTNGGKMPFVQPEILRFPYEEGALAWSDTEGDINDSIREIHTDEEFSGTTLVEDLPQINSGHYSGGGFVTLASRLSAVALDALEHSLGYGSPSLRTQTSEVVLDIANTALTLVGQGAKTITDLSANTTEARLVKRFWQKAVNQLMGQRSWSWATRHEAAALYQHHKHPRYKFAYVVPGRAASVIKVEPFQELDTEGVYVSVIAPIMQDEVIDRGPYRYEIEKSPGGSRILYTDVPWVEGANESPQPIPSNSIYPERLPKRPMLKYIDKNVNPERYSPSFVNALSYLLAGFFAPALIRGQAGMDAQKDLNEAAAGWVSAESQYEAINQEAPLVHQPEWIRARWD